MSADEVRAYEEIAGPLLADLGYELGAQRATASGPPA
jgi:hypothetical protein